MRTFEARKYREDIAELDHRVIASDDTQILVIADAMTREDAKELTIALRSLEAKFNS